MEIGRRAITFTITTVLGGSVLAVVVSMMRPAWNRPPLQPGETLLLSGTAQVGVLALVLALSGYLRQVYSEALKTRDAIRGSAMWNFPPDAKFSQDRIRLLDRSCEQIRCVSPFVLLLAAAVSGRFLADACAQAALIHPDLRWFRLIDCCIAVWLTILLLALMVAHFISRHCDWHIRVRALAEEDGILTGQGLSAAESGGVLRSKVAVAAEGVTEG